MRDAYEVLQEKESAMHRVAREIEILRLAAPLLTDEMPNEAYSRDLSSDLSSYDMRPRGARPGDVLPNDVRPGDVRPDDVRPDFVPTDDPRRNGPPHTDLPSHDLPADFARNAVKAAWPSRPSLLGLEAHVRETEGDDEEDVVTGAKKPSSLLKRLARPWVSFVAG